MTIFIVIELTVLALSPFKPLTIGLKVSEKAVVPFTSIARWYYRIALIYNFDSNVFSFLKVES